MIKKDNMCSRIKLSIFLLWICLYILNGCSLLLKIPIEITYESLYVIRYYYVEHSNSLAIEFNSQDSYRDFCDVKIQQSFSNNENVYLVTIYEKNIEYKELEKIDKKIKRIENGNYIYSIKTSRFRPEVDRLLYLDKKGKHEIQFVGVKTEPFKPFVVKDYDIDLN